MLEYLLNYPDKDNTNVAVHSCLKHGSKSHELDVHQYGLSISCGSLSWILLFCGLILSLSLSLSLPSPTFSRYNSCQEQIIGHCNGDRSKSIERTTTTCGRSNQL